MIRLTAAGGHARPRLLVHLVDERGGVVTEQVGQNLMAARQADGEAPEDRYQSRSPGRHRQLHQHRVGHDGGVTQRVADRHLAVEGHDHEHGVGGAAVLMDADRLNHGVHVRNVALRV